METIGIGRRCENMWRNRVDVYTDRYRQRDREGWVGVAMLSVGCDGLNVS